VLILEFGKIVDVFVDDDVEIGRLVVRRDVTLGEGLGHGGCGVRELVSACRCIERK
jgi:hypothetical protein